MAKKWTNENLPGALHYVTGNVDKRRRIFLKETNCISFLEELRSLIERRASKLICFVVMLDHFHLIVNPRDGDIQTWIGELKSFSAKSLVRVNPDKFFAKPEGENQVWQESFKSLALWSSWMTWQKINYIHQNPLKAGLVKSSVDYRWSSFRSFYGHECEELLSVDSEWWYEDDSKKLKEAMMKRAG